MRCGDCFMFCVGLGRLDILNLFHAIGKQDVSRIVGKKTESINK